MRNIKTHVLAAAAMIALTCGVQAQTKLTYSSWYSSTDPYNVKGVGPYLDRVAQDSNGELAFDFFY